MPRSSGNIPGKKLNMISVLFDLDDTLINNNAEHFTRVYLGVLGKYLKSDVDPQKMVAALLEGTRMMVTKTTIAGTLENTFDRSFYPAIGFSKDQLAGKLGNFYETIFPVLEPETSPRPEAVNVVMECLSHGWNVAVATNPLFPIAAVLHRLKWAGLDSSVIPFTAITSFDTYHFAKPQPAFFSEVAARISAFDHPVVMIGNDLNDDIIPAGNAGIPAFWLNDSKEPLPSGLPKGCASGKMEEIFPWLLQIEQNWDYTSPKPEAALLAALRGGAAAIDAIVNNFPPSQWNTRPSESEWCITEILCHLRDVDTEINLVRVKTILQQTQPFIAGIESDRWSVERDYLHQDCKDALLSFINVRQTLIDHLEQATSEDWNRVIRHSIFGPTTLKELVGFIVGHDNNHIKQIKKQTK
ncbi:MAG TPA: DinB family protein [Leptolinea sp.]